MNFSIFIMPILGAVIGFGTNVLAIIMLFRPHKAIKIGGFKLPFTPGLIPKEQAQLAKSIGEQLGQSVLTPETLMKAATDDEIIDGITKALRGFVADFAIHAYHVKDFTTLHIPKAHSYAQSFIDHPKWGEFLHQTTTKIIKENTKGLLGVFVNPDKIYKSLTKNLIDFLQSDEGQAALAQNIDKLIDHAPHHLLEQSFLQTENIRPLVAFLTKKAAELLISSLNISKIIEEKINQLDPAETEKLLLSVVRKHLKWIAALGGVLGFIIGFVPVLI